MGWLKDVFAPKAAERERKRNAKASLRRTYPERKFNANNWKRISPTSKVKICKDLKSQILELKSLKEGKIIDTAQSDGGRVDKRYRDIYAEILVEYENVFKKSYCDPILINAKANEDRIRANEEKERIAKRIEEQTEKSRKLILGVGGAVLVVGTLIIIKKLK